MNTTITPDMIDAVKVQFIKPIFEDDFVEKGMKAWLTDVEWDEKTEGYVLYFDFTDFEAENDKYLKETYYPNSHTPKDTHRSFFTAKEAGMYSNKLRTYFSVSSNKRDDSAFCDEIRDYLRVVE